MASVDELTAAVAAAKQAIEENSAAIEAAKQQAEELGGQLAGMGVENKSAQAMQVKDSLEEIQGALASISSAVERVQAQAEAIRGLQGRQRRRSSCRGGTSGAPLPAGGLVSADRKRHLADQLIEDRSQMERAVRSFFTPRPEETRPRPRLLPSPRTPATSNH